MRMISQNSPTILSCCSKLIIHPKDLISFTSSKHVSHYSGLGANHVLSLSRSAHHGSVTVNSLSADSSSHVGAKLASANVYLALNLQPRQNKVTVAAHALMHRATFYMSLGARANPSIIAFGASFARRDMAAISPGHHGVLSLPGVAKAVAVPF